MLSRLSSHVRHNVVAYLALFFALSGSAYAAGPLKTEKGSTTMRKAFVALVGTIAVGVLLFPAPAAAKVFHFQGGGDPFGGSPPVGIEMTGKNFKQPKRVTGFAFQPESMECTKLDGGFYPVEGPFDLEGFPIQNDPNARKTRGVVIKRNKKKDLTYFKWAYAPTSSQGYVFDTWELVGGQHHNNPRLWRGTLRVRHSEAGIDQGYCRTAGDDGFVSWEAELVSSL
jgi:hypothetical protein